MLSKMKDYATQGDIRKALVIGQNLFTQNPGDIEVFGAYYSVLWSMVTMSTDYDEKQRYFQLLSSVLANFSETAQLDDSVISYIISKEDSLSLLYEEIQKCGEEVQRSALKRRILKNDDALNQIEEVVIRVETATDKTEFDKLLIQLQQLDAEIDKEYLSDRQKSRYELSTQKCSQIVNNKIRKFEREKNVSYNLQALEAYERVYKYFKENKVSENHKTIISGLFGYDPSRLFNETLTYYNHVYSYVLSKLNDDEKFILTKAAIRTEIRK